MHTGRPVTDMSHFRVPAIALHTSISQAAIPCGGEGEGGHHAPLSPPLCE